MSSVKAIVIGAVAGALFVFLGIAWIVNAPDGDGFTTGARFAAVLFTPIGGGLGATLAGSLYQEWESRL